MPLLLIVNSGHEHFRGCLFSSDSVCVFVSFVCLVSSPDNFFLPCRRAW